MFKARAADSKSYRLALAFAGLADGLLETLDESAGMLSTSLRRASLQLVEEVGDGRWRSQGEFEALHILRTQRALNECVAVLDLIDHLGAAGTGACEQSREGLGLVLKQLRREHRLPKPSSRRKREPSRAGGAGKTGSIQNSPANHEPARRDPTEQDPTGGPSPIQRSPTASSGTASPATASSGTGPSAKGTPTMKALEQVAPSQAELKSELECAPELAPTTGHLRLLR